ncbi:MAG: thioredoxin family protein [Spirochaetes bacterium]|jgi:thioredoxin-related protein|nr:thioredoxin family protein [Spirochaetota bacterium]
MQHLKLKYNSLVIIITCILFALSGEKFLYSDSSLKWYDYNSGSAEAKKLNRYIMIDMYAVWCGWCKVMDKETFGDKKVSELLKSNFIAVRVDMDSREMINYKGYKLRPAEFSRLFGVQGLPTVVFLDSKGEYVDKVPGFVDASLFKKILEYIKDGCAQKNIDFKAYSDGKVKCR